MSALGRLLKALDQIERDKHPTQYANRIASWDAERTLLMNSGMAYVAACREAERRVFGRITSHI